MIPVEITPTETQLATLTDWQRKLSKGVSKIETARRQLAEITAASQKAAKPVSIAGGLKSILATASSVASSAQLNEGQELAEEELLTTSRAVVNEAYAAYQYLKAEFHVAMNEQLEAKARVILAPICPEGLMDYLCRRVGLFVALADFMTNRVSIATGWSNDETGVTSATLVLETIAKFSAGGVVWSFEPDCAVLPARIYLP